MQTAKATHRYRISNTGFSSKRYGPCEVCGKHANETFLQVEERAHLKGWTRGGCTDLFGHYDCLVASRKPDSYEYFRLTTKQYNEIPADYRGTWSNPDRPDWIGKRTAMEGSARIAAGLPPTGQTALLIEGQHMEITPRTF